jgi:hypothetical protein
MSGVHRNGNATITRNSANAPGQNPIRMKARELTIEFWKAEQARQHKKLSARELLPIEPRRVLATLGLRLTELEEIGSIGNTEIAGILERTTKSVTIARRFRPEIVRFTLAHEIGHYVLHPDIMNLRESPLTDDAIRDRTKAPSEREANLFAAELLMPSKVLRGVFADLHGDPVDGTQLDDNRAFYLSGGELSLSAIGRLSSLDRAKLVASSSPFHSADGRCLAEIFAVSATAMAIQLRDLGLVR